MLLWLGILKILFCKLQFPRMIALTSGFFGSIMFPRNVPSLWDITLQGPYLLLQVCPYSSTEHDPDLITLVQHSFFADDFAWGSNNTQNSFELFKKLKTGFLEGKFNVTKWCTNDKKSRQIISNCEPTERVSCKGKVLGVGWNDKSDKLLFDMKKFVVMSDDLCITKHSVLKILAAFYDPLGLIQLLIMNMSFFQGQEKLKLEWDEVLAARLKTEWEAIMETLRS